jgi:hypothetical protein
MKPWLPLLAVLPLATAVPARAARLEIILDVSGSMRAQVGSETRIEAARKAIRATVQGVEPDSVVALRLYGHRVPQEDKAGSCRDSELVVPFKVLDRAAFIGIVDGATPRGQTPLTYSLEQAAQDFGAASDEERVIILVSDGAESCGGDPTAALRKLQAQGFKVKVHTIGLDVDAAARAQLEAISTATGGEYHDARNAAALAESLKRLAQQSLLIEKGSDTLGEAVRGGDGYETAVLLQPGKLYRLDHHQRKSQFDYFYLEGKGRQKITASIETPPIGIAIDGESVREYPYAYAGIVLQDASRQKLGSADVIGNNEKKLIEASAQGRIYLLVGNTNHDQPKDSRFTVALADLAGDAGAPGDAGGTEQEAMPIKPGAYRGTLEEGSDKVDFYRFTADPQATYRVRLRFSSQNTNLGLAAVSADGDVSRRDIGGDSAPLLVKDLKFPKGGEVFVSVGYQFKAGGPRETEYTFDLVQEGVSPAGAQAGVPAGSAAGGPSLLARLVAFLLWSGVPLVVGLLVGGVAGYLFGRRARK